MKESESTILQRTALHPLQKASGAIFQMYNGWELPKMFSDPVEEYWAVRRAAGLIDRGARANLELRGSDRIRFLNGMVTNDVKSLKVGAGLYAAMLTHNGRLLGDMNVYACPDVLLIDLDSSTKQSVLETLQRLAISDDVEITDASEKYAMLGIHGPTSTELLQRLCGSTALPDQEFAHVESTLNGISVRIARTSYTGEIGYDVILNSNDGVALWQLLTSDFPGTSLRPIGMEALNTLRIEAGIPWYGVDMNDETLPLEAGLERALSTTKGCYVGQEIVARILSRGHVNWKLVGYTLRDHRTLERGAKVFKEDQEVGHVTSSAFSPRLEGTVALGYIAAELANEPQSVAIESAGERRAATTVRLPFYSRS